MKIIYKNFSNKDINDSLKIYNFYIKNSFSNFEEKEMNKKTFNSLYENNLKKKLPFIIGKVDNGVIGIAFVNEFRSKSGYRFTYEHSIYINPNYQNKGYGSEILSKLILNCKKNKNIINLIAVIGDSKNIGSIKIHRKNGFKHIGTLKKVGFKKNKWIDSVYMQKKI